MSYSVSMLSCESCEDQPAIRCTAATAYHWDGNGEDPNRDLWLCCDCKEMYYEYYDELWNDYYAEIRRGIAEHRY